MFGYEVGATTSIMANVDLAGDAVAARSGDSSSVRCCLRRDAEAQSAPGIRAAIKRQTWRPLTETWRGDSTIGHKTFSGLAQQGYGASASPISVGGAGGFAGQWAE